MENHLLNLAKELGFKTEIQYFDYIVESYINGQRRQVTKLFKAMLVADQKEFLCNYLNKDNPNQSKIFNICISSVFDYIDYLYKHIN